MEREDRRKYPRYSTHGREIKCKMMYTAEASLINISVGGAYLSVDKRIRIGNMYTLHIGANDRFVTLKGVVVREVLSGLRRNAKGEMVPHYEVGIQFEDVLTDPGRDLISFIEESTQTERQRIRIRGTRVRIMNGSRTVLDLHKNYIIKKIGMGGMLMETDQVIQTNHAFEMELHLDEADAALQCHARIAYSEPVPGSSPPTYDTGVEFLQMSDGDTKRLHAFISTLAESDIHG
jgi:c-di-GMP-binding flagellar brake protein YcgR